MIDIFIKGGPIMWPLLLLSLVTLSAVLDRIVFLFSEAARRDRKVVDSVKKLVIEGEVDKAISEASNSNDRVALILAEGLRVGPGCFESAASCAAEHHLDSYDRGSFILDTAITVAPLLGLLGTVSGMIRSFGLLGASQLEAPVAITGGIAEALIATAFGLAIAITALIPFNILRAKKDQLTRDIEDAATRVEMVLCRMPQTVSINSSTKKAA